MVAGDSHRPGAAGAWLPVLAGWVAGTAWQLTQVALWPAWIYALMLVAAAVAAAAGVARGVTTLARGACLCGFVAVLAFAQVGLRASAFQSRALAAALEGRDLLVTGVVATMPQRGAGGVRFHLQVESASLDGMPVALPPRIQLGWYAGHGFGGADAERRQLVPLPALWAGERWQLPVRLKAPHGNSNPHGFDYELWLWEHGIGATGYVRMATDERAARRLGQTGRQPVEWLRQTVRRRIDDRLPHAAQAGWISALVTGDQNAIERADWDVFRATGVAHLMSISGLHVTMFAWLAAWVTDRLWRLSGGLCQRLPAPHAALLGGVGLSFAYALFSGWGVPAQRTVCMLAVVCLLRLSGRSWPWPMVWLLACVAVLLLDPWAWMQAGFWLSFVAVGVLFAAGGPASAAPAQRPGWAPLRAMLREQAVITLALTPLVLLLFGQMSLVGYVANVLAIPWVTLLVTPLAMAGAFFAPAWDLAAVAITVLASCLAWLAQLPWSTVSVAAAPVWIAVAGVLGGVLLVLRLPVPLRMAGSALVLPVLLWQAPRPAHGQFDLLAADVGQGNAVLVRTAGHALLYDAGPRFSRDSDAGHRVLVPLLRALGADLDLLLLSHRDSDHVGGAASVLAMHPRAALTASLEPAHELWTVRAGTRCEAGTTWRWDGVEFAILHPRAADYQATNKPNALSCVLRIRSTPQPGRPSAVALLTGDIEAAQEKRLIADGALLAADVLLVPHHGSKTSSSAAFVAQVRPRWAWVQSGYRNRFGHPAAVTMATYAEHGAVVVESPQCGAMAWQSGAPEVVSCQRFDMRRYWYHGMSAHSRF